MLKRLLLAALMMMGLAALVPEPARAAPMGPAVTLQQDAAPASVEKAQYYGYGYRRGWGPRRFYGPRPYYRRPFYGPRPYYRRPFYGPRPFYRRHFY